MLSVIVASVETPLDDGALSVLLGYDGWGAAAVDRLTQRGPLQHGHTDLGFRLEPRRASLILGFPVTTLSEMYTRRRQLIDLLKPQNAPTLRWVLPNGDERRIDVHTIGDIAMPWRASDFAALKVAVELEAPDPSFYHPTEIIINYGTVVIANLSFPVAFPIGFGSSIVSSGQNIEYTGSWLAYPKIILTGPFTNPTIENTTIGEKLALTYTVVAGRQITIDLTPGKKTVKLDDGTNLIGVLSEDSDLGTWRLDVHPNAPGGVNNVQVTAGDATTASLIELRWKPRFIGL